MPTPPQSATACLARHEIVRRRRGRTDAEVDADAEELDILERAIAAAPGWPRAKLELALWVLSETGADRRAIRLVDAALAAVADAGS